MSGKGHAPRPIPDRPTYESEWDRIFGVIHESPEFTREGAYRAFGVKSEDNSKVGANRDEDGRTKEGDAKQDHG